MLVVPFFISTIKYEPFYYKDWFQLGIHSIFIKYHVLCSICHIYFVYTLLFQIIYWENMCSIGFLVVYAPPLFIIHCRTQASKMFQNGYYTKALKGCWGIVFTHGIWMGGRREKFGQAISQKP